jgi:uncharacterized protein YbjT (DUF2867 family)
LDLNMPPGPLITVFGGTGFLGRHVVDALVDRGCRVRVAARHPDAGGVAACYGKAEPYAADIRDRSALAGAMEGADGVVNAVGLYREKRVLTFEDVHVAAAGEAARLARENGVSVYVQISGIGSDAGAASCYIRSRGRGEIAVRDAFPEAVIVRPSVMFGEDDAFLNRLAALLRRLPVFPLFGDGGTRLQPVYVGDVAAAIARMLTALETRRRSLCEFGGPQVLTYRELVEKLARAQGIPARATPIPFPLWRIMALTGRYLPGIPVTPGQIALMQSDNVADPSRPGLRQFAITPMPVDEMIERIVERKR